MCRLATTVAQTGEYEVYYSDYYNGLSDKLLDDPRIRKIPYVEGAPQKIFPDEEVVLVTPIYWAYRIPQLHPESKIVFLNWHNECIPVLQKNWRINEPDLDKFLRLVRDTDSVFFLDKTHQISQNYKDIAFPEKFVPITIPIGNKRAKQELVNEDYYNVALVGRLSTDKVWTALDLLNNFSALKLNKEVRIHVIGEGPHHKGFFSHKVASHVKVIRHGTLPREQLVEFLRNEVDILFAMGTSVLEGGCIGIPSVILANEVVPVHCDAYTYLFESEGYMLGWSINQMYALNIPHRPLQEIVADIYENGKKEEIGTRCYQYCIENHSSNIREFLDAVNDSCMTYRACSDFYQSMHRPSWLERVVVRMHTAVGKIYKRFSFFGIPICTLTRRDDKYLNFFFLFLPLFQVERIKPKYIIRFLPWVWFTKAVKYLAGKLMHANAGASNNFVQVQEERRIQQRKRILEKLEKKEKIRVCLFEPRIACWQFDQLYKLLDADKRFEPIIVVIPFLSQGKDAMIDYMDATYKTLKRRGYKVFRGYDKKTDSFLDIKKQLNPDAVFYSMFWKPHFEDHSYITEFKNIYSFLYPYGYDIYWHSDRMQMNFELQNMVSRYYLPTKIHKCIAEENMDNGGRNVFITGSPKLDPMFDKSYQAIDVWKDKAHHKKRIIWAPHHTLKVPSPEAQLCAFLDLYDFILKCAKKYEDRVEFVLKPHPMLKPKLIALWGERKAAAYYATWANGKNTQLVEGDFIDLFLTSDAMILDSISFVAEYTITDKPAFFTYAKDTRFECNKFGKALMKHLYRNESPDTLENEIEQFIENVVLGGEDSRAEGRRKFIQQYMLPENGRSAAANIYEDMCRVIIDDVRLDYEVTWSEPEETAG